ncbi:hypothetical protein OEZ86_013952 [Tetradesmus obliquus]|nr:hypothetical protein OEZ86_013952 [Tetradesmus obliquus]
MLPALTRSPQAWSHLPDNQAAAAAAPNRGRSASPPPPLRLSLGNPNQEEDDTRGTASPPPHLAVNGLPNPRAHVPDNQAAVAAAAAAPRPGRMVVTITRTEQFIQHPDEAEIEQPLTDADIVQLAVPALQQAAQQQEAAAAEEDDPVVVEVISQLQAQQAAMQLKSFLASHPEHFSAKAVYSIGSMVDRLARLVIINKDAVQADIRQFGVHEPSAAAAEAAAAAAATAAAAAAAAAADAQQQQQDEDGDEEVSADGVGDGGMMELDE